MARDVYAWPPVDAIATMWTVRQPINRSTSFFTGADISTSAERKRKLASIVVPGIGDLAGTMNGGYCEMLKEFLEGGKNLVRLNSMPVNWFFDEQGPFDPKSFDVNWTGPTTDVNWTEPTTGVNWITTSVITGTKGTDGTLYTVTITVDVVDGTLVARPGEYVKGFSRADFESGGAGTSARVVRPAYAGVNGTVVIYLMSELTDVYHVELNATVSAVFMVDGDLPMAEQPVDGNWSYPWSFREVFSDEVGGFTEINPWS